MSLFQQLTTQPARGPFLLCLALLGLGLGTVILAGSSFYRRLHGGLQGFFALLYSQAAALLFLPAVQAANFIPHLLSGQGSLAARVIGDALGLSLALPLSVRLCFLLAPTGRARRRTGLACFAPAAVLTAAFLILSLSRGERITALFYGFSLFLGGLTLLEQLQLHRRPRTRRPKES